MIPYHQLLVLNYLKTRFDRCNNQFTHILINMDLFSLYFCIFFRNWKIRAHLGFGESQSDKIIKKIEMESGDKLKRPTL